MIIAGGIEPDILGIWSDEQLAAWKPMVSRVYGKGGIFFCEVDFSNGMSDNALLLKYFPMTEFHCPPLKKNILKVCYRRLD